MTEIGDLSALFGQQQPLTGAQKQAAEDEHQRQHREQDEMHRLMSFFAPLLCNCRRWPQRGNTRPPQEDCVIHGHVMVNPCSGQVYLPGIPPGDSGAVRK